jgi:sterol desaturase/sphingolipid hydroxylase (fatty acid hydroxylase superfamily)
MLDNLARTILQTAWHYLAVVGVFTALWLWWRFRPGRRQRLQAKAIGVPQIRREVLTSIVSIAVLGSVMPVAFALGLGRHTHFYQSVHAFGRGWGFIAAVVVLMMLIQDTWFYWTHRLMHHRRLFRWTHRTHHLSINTSPWSTYSISPLEAVIDSGASIVMLLLLPVTFWSLFIFMWLNTIFAVYTHLGYELFPRALSRHWLGRWINTSTAHNTHHARGRYNYGWYFLFWDRMMGTLSPDYDEHYRKAGFLAAEAKSR